MRAAGSQAWARCQFSLVAFHHLWAPPALIPTNPSLCSDSRLKVDYWALPKPYIHEVTAVMCLSICFNTQKNKHKPMNRKICLCTPTVVQLTLGEMLIRLEPLGNNSEGDLGLCLRDWGN